jgi:hypothetical protein
MKVELLADMTDLRHNGLSIQRPKGTAFRSGDEIFICSPKRLGTLNKTFIIFGFFPVDPKHPELSFVLVIDETALPRDETNLTSIFRSVPLIYVGLVSDGRCVDQTLPLLEAMVPLCKKLFEVLKTERNVQTNSKPKKIRNSLCALDFNIVNSKVRDAPKKNDDNKILSDAASTKRVTRQKKIPPKNVAVHPPVLPGSPEHKSSINQNSSPLFAKKINIKLDSLLNVCTSLQQKGFAQRKRLTAEKSKLTEKVEELKVTCNNLEIQVQKAAVYKADCTLLTGDNDKLKDTVKTLQAADAAKATEIEQLKAEINILQRSLTNALELTSTASSKRKKSHSNSAKHKT